MKNATRTLRAMNQADVEWEGHRGMTRGMSQTSATALVALELRAIRELLAIHLDELELLRDDA